MKKVRISATVTMRAEIEVEAEHVDAALALAKHHRAYYPEGKGPPGTWFSPPKQGRNIMSNFTVESVEEVPGEQIVA